MEKDDGEIASGFAIQIGEQKPDAERIKELVQISVKECKKQAGGENRDRLTVRVKSVNKQLAKEEWAILSNGQRSLFVLSLSKTEKIRDVCFGACIPDFLCYILLSICIEDILLLLLLHLRSFWQCQKSVFRTLGI